MKLTKKDFLSPFSLYDDKLNLLIIENKNEFYKFTKELYNSIIGENGDIVLSKNDTPIKISNSIDLMTQYIPFEINNKKLQTKLYESLSKEAVSAEMYENTCKLETFIKSYVIELSYNYNFELEFDENINLKNLFKSVNLRFSENHDNLVEKIYEYMVNTRDLEGEKLFVLVNFSAFVSDDDLQLLIETAVNHRFFLLLIENNDTINVNNILVNKRIIDVDYCEI